MRIGLVLPSFFEDGLAFMGGGDRYAYQLSRALRPYADITFFTFGPRYRKESLDGLRHVVLPTLRHTNVDNVVPASLQFLSPQFDIVHTYQLRTVTTNLATVVRRAMAKPIVVTDLGGGGRSLSMRLRLYRLVPAFICISEFSRRLLPTQAQARAVAIRGGIDLQRFPYEPRPRERQVLQVGRLMPHKGMNYVIEALGNDIPLVIAGKIVNAKFYRDLQAMAAGKRVRFLIDAPDRVIADEYRRSAVTVAASVYQDMYGGSWPTSELLGLPLLESMSVGTPVICTAVGGMPEYVVDSQTGFIVPPNDVEALRQRTLELLDDPMRATRMGKAGHDHVQQYSWDHVARRVLAEYARLLGKPPAEAAALG